MTAHLAMMSSMSILEANCPFVPLLKLHLKALSGEYVVAQ